MAYSSCMFTALAIVLEHDRKGAGQALREGKRRMGTVHLACSISLTCKADVADAIRKDPYTWSEAVLGMKPAVYCDKIIKKETWGGEEEQQFAYIGASSDTFTSGFSRCY